MHDVRLSHLNKDYLLTYLRSRHGLSNKPSTKVLRCP